MVNAAAKYATIGTIIYACNGDDYDIILEKLKWLQDDQMKLLVQHFKQCPDDARFSGALQMMLITLMNYGTTLRARDHMSWKN